MSKTVTIGFGSWFFWAVVWGCIGYVIYGTLQGALALAAYSAIVGAFLWFGIIPVIGVGITFLILNYVQGWLLNYIAMSWAIDFIFWVGMLGSLVLTIIVILMLWVGLIK